MHCFVLWAGLTLAGHAAMTQEPVRIDSILLERTVPRMQGRIPITKRRIFSERTQIDSVMHRLHDAGLPLLESPGSLGCQAGPLAGYAIVIHLFGRPEAV